MNPNDLDIVARWKDTEYRCTSDAATRWEKHLLSSVWFFSEECGCAYGFDSTSQVIWIDGIPCLTSYAKLPNCDTLLALQNIYAKEIVRSAANFYRAVLNTGRRERFPVFPSALEPPHHGIVDISARRLLPTGCEGQIIAGDLEIRVCLSKGTQRSDLRLEGPYDQMITVKNSLERLAITTTWLVAEDGQRTSEPSCQNQTELEDLVTK